MIGFFLVLCLPRQVRTSNGAIHHDLQLSPSTCCNPLSASSQVTSFLVFLFSFSLPFTFHIKLDCCNYLLIYTTQINRQQATQNALACYLRTTCLLSASFLTELRAPLSRFLEGALYKYPE